MDHRGRHASAAGLLLETTKASVLVLPKGEGLQEAGRQETGQESPRDEDLGPELRVQGARDDQGGAMRGRLGSIPSDHHNLPIELQEAAFQGAQAGDRNSREDKLAEESPSVLHNIEDVQ